LGYNRTSPLYTHITYIFSHAGIFHLIINTIAYTSLHNLCRKTRIIKEALPVSFIAATGASFLSVSDTTTVGASGLIYAMTGCIIAAAAARKIRITNKKKFLLFITCITTSIIAGFLNPAINAPIHLLSYTFALAAAFTLYKTQRTGEISP
jgi:membrane associated rhomboid family serine protease